MPELNVTVKGKIAQGVKGQYAVCGNSDYVVKFDFDEEWSAEKYKTARFIWNEKYEDVVFEGSECNMPIITDTYNVKVGVFAGNLQTTTPAIIITKKSILCGDATIEKPSEDVYSQIMALLNDLKELSDEELAAAIEKYFAEDPIAAEIALNTAARHTHSNKSVLDKFAESDGKPTYDGKAIGGASTADDVGYTNDDLENVTNVKGALDMLVEWDGLLDESLSEVGDGLTKLDKKAHTHDNKTVLDLLTASDGKLQYNGSDIGAELFQIPMTLTGDDEYTVSCDVTKAEVDAAYAAGKLPVVLANAEGGYITYILPLLYTIGEGLYTYHIFGCTVEFTVAIAVLNPEDTWSVNFSDISASDLSYTNSAMKGVYNAGAALGWLADRAHTHDNKTVLEGLSDNSGKLQYKGTDIIDLSSYAKTNEIPTHTSDLANDSSFVNETQLAAAIAAIGHAKFVKVDTVPSAASAEDNVLYLVMNTTTGFYDIYAKVDGEVVRLDDTSVDLSNYVDNDKLTTELAKKQDTISDLTTIRSGAAKGATALQNVPSTYRTAAAQDAIDNGKVDKVDGKALSSNDYTDEAKAKVDAIPADPKYTDTVLEPLIGSTTELSPIAVKGAIDGGRPTVISYTDSTYGTLIFNAFDVVTMASGDIISAEIVYGSGDDSFMLFSLSGNTVTGDWTFKARSVPTAESIPTATSQLENDSGFLTNYTETDPTVPNWAKAANKPTYAYSEISGTPSTLKNPNALTIVTGNTTVVYDGSEAKTVEIAGTDAIVGTVDSENNITLTGNLADGTYTLTYEMEDGTTTEIGTLTVGGGVAYTNLFDPSTATLNVRWSNSAYSLNTTANGYVASAYIPVTVSSDTANPTVLRWRGAAMSDNASIVYYDASKTIIASPDAASSGADANARRIVISTDDNGDTMTNLGWKSGAFVSTWANAAYIRVVLQVNATSTAITNSDIQNIIITVNELIAD